MAVTKVFRSANSQAVRIPRQFRFRSMQVEITKRGDEIVLRERPANLAAAYELLTGLSSSCGGLLYRPPRARSSSTTSG